MENVQSIERYLQRVPKAELHVHLEGSIRPSTLLTLAQRNNVILPVSNLAEMREWFRFRDFPHFIEIYSAITRCLKTAEDYELIAYEFGVEMARQHVRYAEVTVSPSTHRYSLGLAHDTFFGGLNAGRERAQQEFGVHIQWVFDIVRGIPDETERRRRAEYTTAAAIEAINDGVVALGLGGYERDYPPEQFAGWFDRALSAGLHSVPHAGETVGPRASGAHYSRWEQNVSAMVSVRSRTRNWWPIWLPIVCHWRYVRSATFLWASTRTLRATRYRFYTRLAYR